MVRNNGNMAQISSTGSQNLKMEELLRRLLPFISIWGLGMLVYFKSLAFGFTYLDDNVFILNYQHLLSRFSGILDIFRRPDVVVGGYYRPVPAATFALNAIIGADHPFFYHLGNVVFHIAAAGLVFKVLTMMGYLRQTALFFGLIFTVHPALTNPVVWIPGRADILLAIFCLGGFILFLHFLRDRSPLAYFGHMLFFALALLCRENALALPAVCLSYILFIAREKPFSFNQRLLGSGWLAIVFLWVFLRRAILVNPLEVGVVDAVRSVWKAAPAVIQYLGKAIFPFNLSVLPVIKDTGFIWGVLAVILILFGLLLSKKKRPRIVLFGAAWYLLFLAPCFIRPYTRSVDSFLEHRAYASFLGLFIVLLETDFVKALNLIKGPARLIAGCVLLMALSGIAFFYSGNYKDRMSFWQSAVKTSPHSPLAHRNLGAMYHLDGKLERAEEEYKEALRINPYEPMANNNLGLIFMKKGQVAQAEQAFLKELSFNPDYDDANYNIGLLYYQLDRKDEAVRLWEKTVRINPNHKQALECLGKI